MVKIEIDGQEYEAPNGAMVIEAADAAGIRIPRFCYHKKLSIAANCRMCLVEVEKAAKPMPACATPVTEGMKVFTRSPKALAAQKSVMEFLLINHPLDCPICDQGGECELQDVAMGYGGDVSKYSEMKRVVREKDIGPLIATDMTRCIHCTRCVRFGDEIAGLRELGATGRGEHMEIGTYIQKAVSSEMSGNVIDICPVGALTSKPFRYSARAWEMRQHESIAPHDCIGSNIFIHTRRDQVMRVVPRENEQVNETWISDRDRFSYTGLYSSDRLTRPMVKQDGQWRETDWDTALQAAANGIKSVIDEQGAEAIGSLMSPSCTIEEMYLAQKLVRGLGSNNIDHRLRQRDFSDQDRLGAFPWLGQGIADLESARAVLLVGSDIRREQPIAGHRLRKAGLDGASIMAVNPVDYDFNFKLAHKAIVDPRRMEQTLLGIVSKLLQLSGAQAPQGLDLSQAADGPALAGMAEALHNEQQATVLLGAAAVNHARAANIRALCALIGQLSGARVGYLSDGANSAGAWLTGAVPHRAAGNQPVDAGLNAMQMAEQGLGACLLMNFEPDADVAEPDRLMASLNDTRFVVALGCYKTQALLDSADVLMPISGFGETSGTFVNAEGRWQSFAGVVPPAGDARPGWKILRVIGNLLNVDGFDYLSSEEVCAEARQLAGDVSPDNAISWTPISITIEDEAPVMTITDVPIYSVDAMTRRARPLQVAQKLLGPGLRINTALAQRIGLNGSREVRARQGEIEARVQVEIDDRVPENCIWIHADISEASRLGTSQQPIELEKV